MKRSNLIKQEYRRILFSYKTLIFLGIFLLVAALNFYFSYLVKAELLEQLLHPAEDINLSALKNWLSSYYGFKFFFDFYDMSDEFQVGLFLIFAWLGIFLSGELARQKRSGYGNFPVSRMGYKNYATAMLTAQSMYIATLIALAMALQVILAFSVGGVGTLCYQAGDKLYPLPECILLILALYLTVTIYSIAINWITASFTCFVHKVYFLQAMPFLCSGLLPIIIFGGLSSIVPLPRYSELVLSPIHALSQSLQFLTQFSLHELFARVLGLIILVGFAMILFRISVIKLRKDYLP